MESLVTPFWSGKKVFVTGHTGFKGSWLSLWLELLGADVYGYALQPPTHPNLFTSADIASKMHSFIADIRQASTLKSAMQTFAPEIVFHLAAQPIVRLSYEQPLETFEINVMGTANLLEAVRHTPSVRAVVVVTSDKCYENKQWEWPYRETDELGGHDPYSASKACAELVTNSYRSSFLQNTDHRVTIATARAGNVIGGGDWARDRLIPDIIRSFSTGQTVHIRHPKALRPWQHVLEPLRGYLTLAEELFEHGQQRSGAWNFGPGTEAMKPVEWIVAWMADFWGKGAAWQIDPAHHLHEAASLTLDSSRAAAHLGWRPRLILQDALTLTVTWYQQFIGHQDVRESCIRQIQEYSAKVT